MSLVCPACGKKVNWMGPSGLCVDCNDKRKKSGLPARSRTPAQAAADVSAQPADDSLGSLGLVGRSQRAPVEYAKGIKRFGWIIVALGGTILGAYLLGMAMFASDVGIASLNIGEGGSTRRARGLARLVVSLLGERGAVAAWGLFAVGFAAVPVAWCIRFSTDLRNKLALATLISIFIAAFAATWNAQT